MGEMEENAPSTKYISGYGLARNKITSSMAGFTEF